MGGDDLTTPSLRIAQTFQSWAHGSLKKVSENWPFLLEPWVPSEARPHEFRRFQGLPIFCVLTGLDENQLVRYIAVE